MEYYGFAAPGLLGMTCLIAILHIKPVTDTFSDGIFPDCGIRFSGKWQKICENGVK
jgi:hypothetical protein